jgi:branched-chain amino acid transport system ATP-binding protein
MLKLEKVCVTFGAVEALRDVTLHVDEGEVVALLGTNGAGKSTLLHAISGLVALQSGTIALRDLRLDRMKAHAIVAAGVSHCPEGRRVFAELSVVENLHIGAYLVHDQRVRQERMEHVFHYFPSLAQRRFQMAGTLSGGEQQMLAVGRCLMSGPRLIMLDEPSLGLAPMLIDQIFDIIRQINRDGMTVLLVEQNANEALLHADRGYVIENGRITLEGTADALHRDARVVEAYLG